MRRCALLDAYIETAKANGLIPFDYIMTLLEQANPLDYDIDTLLPWMFDKR